MRGGKARRSKTDAAVLDIALTHHLVSKYTSLIAVDVTPTRPDHAAAVTTSLPPNVPGGLNFVGGLPRTATPAPQLIVAGFGALLLALAIAALSRPTLRFARACKI